MGFDTGIEKVFDFVYRAAFDNGLTEYEFDHVFAGYYDGAIHYNKEEVMDYCYKSLDEIKSSLTSQPHRYTAWFQLAFPKVVQWWLQQKAQEVV